MSELYITKAVFGFGTHTSSINLDLIEHNNLNSDLFQNHPISVNIVIKDKKETVKCILTNFMAYTDSRNLKAEQKFLEIINTIMRYSKTKDMFDIQSSDVDSINSELSTLVFKDILDLFKIKEFLTYEQTKQVIDELFIIEPIHN